MNVEVAVTTDHFRVHVQWTIGSNTPQTVPVDPCAAKT